MVSVLPYSDSWARHFRDIRSSLQASFEEAGVQVDAIEHVGSTSVVGLSAKPILDIDIVASREDMSNVMAVLEQIGYTNLGEMGITDRFAFKQSSGIGDSILVQINTNVYVVERNSIALRNHVAVRDTLRNNSILMGEYDLLKREISQSAACLQEYCCAKTDFIVDKVLRESRAFSKNELLDIKNANTV